MIVFYQPSNDDEMPQKAGHLHEDEALLDALAADHVQGAWRRLGSNRPAQPQIGQEQSQRKALPSEAETTSARPAGTPSAAEDNHKNSKRILDAIIMNRQSLKAEVLGPCSREKKVGSARFQPRLAGRRRGRHSIDFIPPTTMSGRLRSQVLARKYSQWQDAHTTMDTPAEAEVISTASQGLIMRVLSRFVRMATASR